MTLKMTKEEFLLLLEMYQQGQQMILLKKQEKIDIPPKYTVDKYLNLLGKMFEQAINEKIPEEDVYQTSEDFMQIILKFNKTKKEKDDLMNLYMQEMLQNQMWRDSAIEC